MKNIGFLIFAVLIVFTSCNQAIKKQSNQNKKEQIAVNWYDDAVIYEVNVRQYTTEGTFNAFSKHLPRLKEMGVEILWIMPIQPISVKNRKGTLGSYYSIADYSKINPEFGTIDDFKLLVQKSHEMGMKVIIDWVANHTGWDNPWILEHPEWYSKDSTGKIISPVPDWSDVADLNFSVSEMRKEMINAMDFWLKETNIDGFRCDVAWGVPTDFWEEARASFDSIKPVFMLAEDEDHLDFLNYSFRANYAWQLHHIMNEIARGEKNAGAITEYFEKSKNKYPGGSFPMQFITNHDENSWQGTIEERMGKAADAFALFSFTIPGMPLIYSGQEVGLNKRLLFFEKDEIDWTLDSLKSEFYSKLIDLKQNNKALWNGKAGADIDFINTNSDEKLLAFKRQKEDNSVLVLINMTNKLTKGTILLESKENYWDYFLEDNLIIGRKLDVEMRPWEFKVYIKN